MDKKQKIMNAPQPALKKRRLVKKNNFMKNYGILAFLLLLICTKSVAQHTKKIPPSEPKPFGSEVKTGKIQPAFGRIGLEFGLLTPKNGNQTTGQAKGIRAEIGIKNFVSVALNFDAQTGADSLISAFQTCAGLHFMPKTFGRMQPFLGAGYGFGFGQANGGGGRGGGPGGGGPNGGNQNQRSTGSKPSYVGQIGFNFVLAAGWILGLEENYSKQIGTNAAKYPGFSTKLAISYQFGTKNK
jgi:hypothetical protein